MYVDDCILISKEQSAITTFVQSLRDGPENFVFTEEGTLESYLGVCITKFSGNAGFGMSQPFLIGRIIKAIGFEMAKYYQRCQGKRPSCLSFAQ